MGRCFCWLFMVIIILFIGCWWMYCCRLIWGCIRYFLGILCFLLGNGIKLFSEKFFWLNGVFRFFRSWQVWELEFNINILCLNVFLLVMVKKIECMMLSRKKLKIEVEVRILLEFRYQSYFLVIRKVIVEIGILMMSVSMVFSIIFDMFFFKWDWWIFMVIIISRLIRVNIIVEGIRKERLLRKQLRLLKQ